MSSLKTYLAEKYMSGPKADAILARSAPPKKKRRKNADASGSTDPSTAVVIADDDVIPWAKDVQEEKEEDAPEFVEERRGFRKKKSGGWQTIREPSPEDEKPQLVLPDGRPLRPPAPQRAKERSPTPPPAAVNPEQETVYRDASGRKIDLSVERAERKRLEREKAEKEAKRMQWGKGLVQREEQEKRQKELEEEAKKGWARGADDEQLNKRLKEEDRWNDPAAAFLTKKKSSGSKKPMYQGPIPPPNRFGIPPGYRWDGVDRSNGFEKKFFQRQNERSRRGLEAYEWSVDDM